MQNIALDFESFYLHFLYQKPYSARQYNGSDKDNAFKKEGCKIMQ
jgi:hypothetical protein